jgi:hypothetical protein
MRRPAVGAFAAAALLALGSPLAAQTLGAGLGPTFSLDGGGVDFHLMATLRFDREVGNPVGFRVDGMLQFTGSDNLFIGTVNAIYNFVSSPQSRIRPYVIGGAGLYADGGTDFGINAGLGATFPLGFGDSPARAFAEARYHAIFAEGSTVDELPLTVGIMFRVGS